MSRNIPRHLRQKQGPALQRVITHDVSVMVLRTGAILIWCYCLTIIGIVGTDLIRNSHAAVSHLLWQPLGLAAASVAGLLLGWRLWELRRWAAVVTLVLAWAFSLGEPWRPAHYPGGIIDVTAAIGAGLLISALVAAPLTWAWVKERSRLNPGF